MDQDHFEITNVGFNHPSMSPVLKYIVAAPGANPQLLCISNIKSSSNVNLQTAAAEWNYNLTDPSPLSLDRQPSR